MGRETQEGKKLCRADVCKKIVMKYLGKDIKLYAVFKYLEKAHDKIDREAFWNVYGVRVIGRK